MERLTGRLIRRRALLSAMLIGFVMSSCLQSETKPVVDLDLLAGDWEGIFEYLDYSDDATRMSLPASLIVTLPEKGDGTGGPAEAALQFTYREDSGADAVEEVVLRYYPSESLVDFNGNWAVIDSQTDPQSAYLYLVFTGSGEDGDREALIRQTIERSGDTLLLRREVRYGEVSDYIVRNEYRLHLVN
ncbi:MAG: hypothetical protein R3C44_22690 [Chloroflexota bacterium]